MSACRQRTTDALVKRNFSSYFVGATEAKPDIPLDVQLAEFSELLRLILKPQIAPSSVVTVPTLSQYKIEWDTSSSFDLGTTTLHLDSMKFLWVQQIARLLLAHR